MIQDSELAASAGRLRLADGLSVNRLGYGAMRLPGPMIWGPPADPEAALAVLRRAAELGVDHFDTSDAYGPRVSNELIRDALSPYPENLVVATKVGVERGEDRTFTAAASPDRLRAQVEQNLASLGKSTLDLVYLRAGGDGMMPPADTPFVESFAALARLRERGLIRHLGLSGVTVEQLGQARTVAPVVAVQNRYHLLDRGSADVLRYCEENGLAFVPYFPLAAGMLKPDLDRSMLPPGMGLTEAQEATLDTIAERHEATRAQIALAWLLAVSPVTLLIAGTTSLAHLEDNLAVAGVRLSDEEVAELDTFA